MDEVELKSKYIVIYRGREKWHFRKALIQQAWYCVFSIHWQWACEWTVKSHFVLSQENWSESADRKLYHEHFLANQDLWTPLVLGKDCSGLFLRAVLLGPSFSAQRHPRAIQACYWLAGCDYACRAPDEEALQPDPRRNFPGQLRKLWNRRRTNLASPAYLGLPNLQHKAKESSVRQWPIQVRSSNWTSKTCGFKNRIHQGYISWHKLGSRSCNLSQNWVSWYDERHQNCSLCWWFQDQGRHQRLLRWHHYQSYKARRMVQENVLFLESW